MAKGRNSWSVLVLLVIGALFGSIVGELLAGYAPFLNTGGRIGFTEPMVFRFAGVLTLVFGLSIKVNLATVFGMVLAAFVALRMR